jgi:uncharacterized protein (TIGR03086 family)
MREADGVHRAHGILVLTIAASRVTRSTMFLDPALLTTFALPRPCPPPGTWPRRQTGVRAGPRRQADEPAGSGCSNPRSGMPSRRSRLSRRSSCRARRRRAWDPRMLLRHASESPIAICEGIEAGCIDLFPSGEDADVARDPAQAFRHRAARLLEACTSPAASTRSFTSRTASWRPAEWAGAVALEIAVHGWDISRACGYCEPTPPELAADLLAVAPLLVPGTDRRPLFAPPASAPPEADPSDRLAAFLGRSPLGGKVPG